MTRRLGIAIFLCAFLFSEGFAQIQFSVSTDRNRGVVGEEVTITATIVSSQNLKGLAAPPLPKSEYYNLLRTSQNQHQSSSIQIVNGRMSQTVEITYLFYYVISLAKEGTFTFPSLTLAHEGKNYTSDPFTISVGKEAPKVPGGSGDLALQVRVSKAKLYVGEQTILTFDILKKPQAPIEFSNEGFTAVITAIENALGKNFSVTRLFKDKLVQTQRAVNGEVRQIFSLSFAIIPINPGTHTIPPLPFQYIELRRVQQSRDIFDDFFGGGFFGGGVQQVGKSANTNSLTITVAALPQQPAGFSGAVGSFSLNASASTNTVPSGEAVTLTITHSGSTRPGNLPDLTLPRMTDFEVFTPEKHVTVDTTPSGIRTSKRYNFLLIPREEGQRTIPSIQWTYFDPVQGTYKTLSTSPITLVVTKGTKETAQQTRYLTQEDIRELGQDIRYIKTPKSIKNQTAESYKNPLFLILFPIPFCIMLFSLLYRIQATLLKKDPSITLRKKAYRTVEKKVNKLRKEFATSLPAHAVSDIAAIIEEYISHSFGFAAAGKTWDQLKEELHALRVDQDVIDTLIPLMEQLDTFRFGGLTADKKAVFDMLEQTLVIIEKLEKREKKQ